MPRIKVVLNKTNTSKLNKFLKWASKNWTNIDNEILSSFLIEEIKKEIKNQRENCSEKSIVENWINLLQNIDVPNSLEELKSNLPEYYSIVRKKLINQHASKTFDNNIDIYFNDVKKEYILHPQSEQNEIEFLPENKEIFIKNNLKLVVTCAKRYQNMGLPFEDLIQAGNEGLLEAFNRFDGSKAKLRNSIIEDIENSDLDRFTLDDASNIIKHRFTYEKLLDNTLNKIPSNGFESKEEFIEWAKINIRTAVFASVAFKWIRSAIVTELNKYGIIIKSPKKSKKKDINEDFEDYEEPKDKNIQIIKLDSINPYTDDNYSDASISIVSNEEFIIENETLENNERRESFTIIVESLLANLDNKARQIVKKKYGINYPYQMTISEIAESENVSVNNVKKILRDSMLVLQENLTSQQKDALNELL